MHARYFPWLDRSGRLSALKLAVLAALFAPTVWIAVQYDIGRLDTVKSVVHEAGLWAIRILLVSLAVSPLRRIAGWNKLIAVRRMLGVAALFYVLAHFALYIVEDGFDLSFVASEILRRLYLTVGFAALLGLAVLGATSTDAAIRRLGPGRWNRLHALVYGITVLALVHDMLQAKLDIGDQLLLMGLFVLLMGWRLLARFKLGEDPIALVGLAVAATALTGGFEAAWYHIRNGIDVADVLAADLSLDDGLRPVWFVLIAGLLAAALRFARPLWSRASPARRLRAVAR